MQDCSLTSLPFLGTDSYPQRAPGGPLIGTRTHSCGGHPVNTVLPQPSPEAQWRIPVSKSLSYHPVLSPPPPHSLSPTDVPDHLGPYHSVSLAILRNTFSPGGLGPLAPIWASLLCYPDEDGGPTALVASVFKVEGTSRPARPQPCRRRAWLFLSQFSKADVCCFSFSCSSPTQKLHTGASVFMPVWSGSGAGAQGATLTVQLRTGPGARPPLCIHCKSVQVSCHLDFF